MMRITGSYDSAESSGAENDEIVENDNSSLVDKIDYLEKKILEQGDEIICLRSTLANVVRRLEQIEAQSKFSGESWGHYSNTTKNGASRTPGENRGLRTPNYGFNSKIKDSVKRSLSTANNALHQRRQTHYQSTNSLHSGQSSHSEANSSNSASPIPISPSASTHSNSPGVHPVIRQAGNSLIPKGDSNRSSAQSPSLGRSTSNLQNSKRWSSTGDFGTPSQIPSVSQGSGFSRSTAKSLLNLFPKHQMTSSFAHGNKSKYGRNVNNKRKDKGPKTRIILHEKRSASTLPCTPKHITSSNSASKIKTKACKDLCYPFLVAGKTSKTEIIYNEKEGIFRMYIMGRPVVLHIPTPLVDTYDLNTVTKPPSERLKLDWVYGYRGRDCRSNLYYLPTGEMVYFVAAVVVLYNVEEQSQRHYLGHTDDVKSLAVHPNKMLVATGQCAGHDRKDAKPHIRIWNSVSLHTISVIGLNEFEKSICCLTFSKVDGGALLCAIDESSDHLISIWDWQKKERGAKLTENKCSVDTVVAAEFHPLDRHCIVTCGKSHIAFWILDQNGSLYKRMGIFENRDKPKYVTCLAFTQNGDTLSGDSNGNIIVWGRGTNTILKLIRGIHDSTVLSICVLKDGAIVTGGGKDGKLVLLNSEFLPADECYIAEQYGGVRQVSESRGSQLLVGTTKNCILIGSVTLGFTPVIVGHTEEIWGCAAHPSLPQFVTAGFDGNIHFWDSMARSLVWTKDMNEAIQSVCFTPDGCLVIAGSVNGKWFVLDCTRREIICAYQDGNEPIQDCKFSPDGTNVALASRDNTIYLYQVSEDFTGYNKIGRCVGHSSFITHIDWSSDSQFIRSNSGDYELLFWQANLCRQVTQTSSLRDIEWATNDCIITFNTIGIWQEGMDGTDINDCAKSHDSRLLAAGDDFGKIKLYTYPVIYPKSLYHTGGGHSSHVTNVEFLHDDSRIISLGGKDTSVFQWKIS